MSRFHSYINSARDILGTYRGEEPFAEFSRKYFAANKKFGSRDRKQVRHLCYCFFRMGKMGMAWQIEDRLIAGLFLCSDEPNDVLDSLKPEWNKNTADSLPDKLTRLQNEFGGDPQATEIFPWPDQLSDGIDYPAFCQSFLIQPNVFLRIRPGHENEVEAKLSAAGIGFKGISQESLALPPGSEIETAIQVDREAVIQDLNSQRTAELFKSALIELDNQPIDAWDCCAGSGGKSIMLYDLAGKINLTVSDIRPSIINNLKKRFDRAGISDYHSLVSDLSASSSRAPRVTNLLVCDVPCTGSGTWGRTPEQLYFFDEKTIIEYAARQKKIVSNGIRNLADGGVVVYITCSVFKKENEEVIDFIQRNFPVRLLRAELLTGYDKRADTMFAAVLKKQS